MKKLSVALLIGAIALVVTSLVYASGVVTILISEVEYDTTTGSEPATEWFELYNTTGSPQTISSWTITDNNTSDTIPDITIPAVGIDGQPGGTIVVAGDKTAFLSYYLTRYGQSFPRPDLVVDVGGSIGNGLSNTGDHLILRDNEGTEIDAVSWGTDTTVFTRQGVDAGHSLARDIRPSPANPVDTDTAADWFDNDPDFGRPTPDFSLPVTLSSFAAIPTDSGVMLKWRTESEVDNLGWNIYRNEKKDGEFVKINDKLIPGAGNSAMPNSYQFVDKTVVKGRQYYYYLEDVDIAGTRSKSLIIPVNKDAGKLTTTWSKIK
jgi:hypothetical protein